MIKECAPILHRNEWLVIDRRGKSRLECLCPALVRGYDVDHKLVKAQGTITNLSASGLYLRLDEKVEIDPNLLVVFSFPPQQMSTSPAPKIAVRG